MQQIRTMWTLFEPVHAVTYFAPQARASFEACGLRGFWRGYFAGRAAPMGPVGPDLVYATFFGFQPAMVHRAVPDVWQRADPATALAARLDGARQALAAVLPASANEAVEEAAELVRQAVTGIDVAGRALAAANTGLPWPDDPLGSLWHGATILREHRGDGHVAALVAAGLDGAQAQVWRAALDGTRAVLQVARGWSDDEWDIATRRLVTRGLLTDDGSATPAARDLYDQIEGTTDTLAAEPWDRLGPDGTARLATLLAPITAAASGYLPHPSPIGLPPPPSV